MHGSGKVTANQLFLIIEKQGNSVSRSPPPSDFISE